MNLRPRVHTGTWTVLGARAPVRNVAQEIRMIRIWEEFPVRGSRELEEHEASRWPPCVCDTCIHALILLSSTQDFQVL